MIELELRAPLHFDESIGYWTGEPDLEAVTRALGLVPEDPEVRRSHTEAGVLLIGPPDAVMQQAEALRAVGLE